MRKFKYFILSCCILLSGCSNGDDTDFGKTPVVPEPETLADRINQAEWEINEVNSNISWKYYHFDNLFNSRQSITIFEVNRPNETVDVEIPYVESGFLKTSDAAIQRQALVAINGSYFDTTNGGSTVYFKDNGVLINKTKSNFNSYRENAGLAIDISGNISVIGKPSLGWEKADYNTLLVSGPLLMIDGKLVEQKTNKFNDNRHPRTAIGITGNGQLIAVVIDGRASEAHGVTVGEMAEIMDALGCKGAMNLDGGGSSTAWVKNRGVVNFPSDNKKFDHEGERGVATVITILSK